MEWTFIVNCTFGLWRFSNRFANLVGIAIITRRTDAVSSVIISFAYRIDTTLVVIDARILALLTYACKGSGTVRINGALWFAFLERISLQPRWTSTDASVANGSSDGVESTG
jgi:hypothetical protein